MPLIIILGLAGHAISSKSDLVYLGDNGDAANEAIAKVPPGKYVRGLRLVNPTGVPVAFNAKLTKEDEAQVKLANERRERKRKELEATEAKRAEAAANAAKTHAQRVKEEAAKIEKAAAEKKAAEQKADEEIRAKMKAENKAARERLKK